MLGKGKEKINMNKMMMIKRIKEIYEKGGELEKGYIREEYDVSKDEWYLNWKFKGKKIMKGCIGIEGMWKIKGLLIGWMGEKGRGMEI